MNFKHPGSMDRDNALRKWALGWSSALAAVCVLPWAVLADGSILWSWNVFRIGPGRHYVILAYLAVAALFSLGLGLPKRMPLFVRSFGLFSIGLVSIVYNLLGMGVSMTMFFISLYVLLFALHYRHHRIDRNAGRGGIALGVIATLFFFLVWHGLSVESTGARGLGRFLGITLSRAGFITLAAYEWLPVLLTVMALSAFASPTQAEDGVSFYPLSRVSFHGLLYYVAGYRLLQGIVALCETPQTAWRVLPTFLYPAMYLGAFYTFFVLGGGQALLTVMERMGLGDAGSDSGSDSGVAMTDRYLPP